MRLNKSYVAEYKAGPVSADGTVGEFEALVSVFGNVDLQQDRVLPGAFTKTLDTWRASGDPIPIIWSHDWGNPHAIIGSADPGDVTETKAGLLVKGKIDLTNPFAAQVHNLMRQRLVKEFSFAYDVVLERQAKDGANDLVTLDLIEAGPTLKGANPDTQLVGVKRALEEAARMSRTGSKDVYAAIAGSDEERRHAIQDAVQAWGDANYPNDPMKGGWGPYVCVAATFSDHVLVSVEEGEKDDEYFEIPYTVDASGQVTLGAAAQASVEVQVVAKAAKLAHKAKADDEKDAANGAAGGLREHLQAAAPDGHGQSEEKVLALTSEELEKKHTELHDAGAEHDQKAADAVDGGDGAAADEPLPSDAAGFRTHLKAAVPAGHAKDAAKVDGTPDGFLGAEHKRIHEATGYSGHSHAGITNGPAKDDEKAAGDMSAFDEGAWDGPAAMSACLAVADPAGAFAKVCAGKRAGDQATEAAWVLPHHAAPGDPASVKGVSAAMGRFDQVQGMTNSAEAKAHLQAHQDAIDAAKAQAEKSELRERIAALTIADGVLSKAGRTLSAKNEGGIKSAVDAIDVAVAQLREVLASVAAEPVPGKSRVSNEKTQLEIRMAEIEAAANDASPLDPTPPPSSVSKDQELRTRLLLLEQSV